MIYSESSVKIDLKIRKRTLKMKKIIAFFLLIIMSLTATVSCGEEYYEPVASTEEEAKTVFTLSFGGESFDVKYELYRALFLTVKGEVDGGDSSVWEGEGKAEYVKRANELVFARLTEIYSIFSLAKEIGIDVYSKEYNNDVNEIIKVSVDGGMISEGNYTGFSGDYEKYLASLKEMNLNYSVQDLLIRYTLATDAVYYYYAGNVNNDATLGKLQYTRDDVYNFYTNEEECVRVYQLYLSLLTTSYTESSIQTLRDRIASVNTEEDVISIMIGSSVSGTDIENGKIIGKYNLDSLYYSQLTEAAFSLSYYKTSSPIRISTSVDDGYYVIYRTRKSDEHFNACYDEIAKVYVENKIGEIISKRAGDLLATITESDFYKTIEHSKISMD